MFHATTGNVVVRTVHRQEGGGGKNWGGSENGAGQASTF